MSFCHLHVHSEYSLLDSLCRLPQLVNQALKFNMQALALTDHGGLWGIVPFYKLCLKAGIKPIIGCEVYVVDNHRKSDKENPTHLVLLAENQEGYQNLLKLVTISHLDGFTAGLLGKKLLSAYSQGIIALSGCLKGEIPQKILQNDIEGAQKIASEYAKIFESTTLLGGARSRPPGRGKISFWLKSLSENFLTTSCY